MYAVANKKNQELIFVILSNWQTSRHTIPFVILQRVLCRSSSCNGKGEIENLREFWKLRHT